MRGKARVLLLAATCVVPTACITGFKHPLGSVEEAFVEPNLVGNWACSSEDDPTPAALKIMDFDGKQYYIELDEGKSDPARLRGLAHRVEDAAFLSVRGLETKEEEWNLLAYALSDSDHLEFGLVDAPSFEDVMDDPLSVKQRLAEQMRDPEIVASWLKCTRAPKPQV
jgi:hypothetical protein